MEKPLNITFRGLDGTPELKQMIENRAARLERHCDYIIGCDIVVELQQKAMRSGSNYRVRIDITFPPGHEVVAEYSDNDTDGPVPLNAAIQRAFANAEKQLDKLVDKQHGHVKRHPQQASAEVLPKSFEPDR